jgi:hypothetical protein
LRYSPLTKYLLSTLFVKKGQNAILIVKNILLVPFDSFCFSSILIFHTRTRNLFGSTRTASTGKMASVSTNSSTGDDSTNDHIHSDMTTTTTTTSYNSDFRFCKSSSFTTRTIEL